RATQRVGTRLVRQPPDRDGGTVRAALALQLVGELEPRPASVRRVGVDHTREDVVRETVSLGERAQEQNVAREGAAGEGVTGSQICARTDAALALEPARDLRRVGAHRLADDG